MTHRDPSTRRLSDALDRRLSVFLIVAAAFLAPLVLSVLYDAWSIYRSGSTIVPGATLTAVFWTGVGFVVLAFQRVQWRAAIVVAVLAVAIDVMIWHKSGVMGSPALTDLLALGELLRTLSTLQAVAVVLALAGPGLIAAVVLLGNLAPPSRDRLVQAAFGLVVLAIWSGALTFIGTGRTIVSPLHVAFGGPGGLTIDALARHRAADLLTHVDVSRAPVSGLAGGGALSPGTRPIHVIIVESWMMTARFAGGRAATDPRLAAWSDATGPGLVAPVFGGRSSEARFELLCGLPAADPGNRVPHWRIDGPLDCLPALFAAAGFPARASTPGPPDVFKVGRVLPLLGFTAVRFRDSYPPPHSALLYYPAERAWQTDAPRLLEGLRPGQPALTWHVVLQGHWPWPEQPGDRPPAERWAAALAAATRAVVDRVEAIRAADPTALIVVASDHAPPNVAQARLDAAGLLGDLTVPVALLGPQGPIPLPLMAHWELPYHLLDIATDGRFCRRVNCPDLDGALVRPLKTGILTAERDGSGPRVWAFDAADADADALSGVALMALTDQRLAPPRPTPAERP